MAKCVELRAAGYSRDKIRQYLNYEMKARTRLGGHWTTSRIDFLVQQGLRLMAETVNGIKYLLASADDVSALTSDRHGGDGHPAPGFTLRHSKRTRTRSVVAVGATRPFGSAGFGRRFDRTRTRSCEH